MDYLVAPERLETPRFVVRSWLPGDGAAMSDAVCGSYDHLRPWLPWPRPDQGADESEQIARRFRGRWLLAEDFTLAVLDPDERRVLGGSGFHLRHAPLSARAAEIGMWIRADDAGQGLGTALLTALLGWGFDAWPWLRLEWRCDSRNTASARTAEKAGMVLEGRFLNHAFATDGTRTDTLVFAAHRGTWRPPGP